jgi:hypothetical protein
MLGPVLEREVAAREGELVLAKVDVDANQGLAGEYGIRGIPGRGRTPTRGRLHRALVKNAA